MARFFCPDETHRAAERGRRAYWANPLKNLPTCERRFFQHLKRSRVDNCCKATPTRYNAPVFRIPFCAEVAKSVDAVDSKSTVEIRAGSSPAFGTK